VTFSDLKISGTFSNAAVVTDNNVEFKYTTFYAASVSNSFSAGAPVWNLSGNLSTGQPNTAALGYVNVLFSPLPMPNYIADADNVTASKFVPSVQPTLSSQSMVLDVTKYGIKGDINTDNTAALQNLINSAPQGSVFFFPQGFYRVTGTIDFSRLKSFSVIGVVSSAGGDAGGSTIQGNFAGPLVKIDYGSSAGSFQIRNLNLISSSDTALYARNAVLSNIQNVQTWGKNGLWLDNPFMVTMRSIPNGHTNAGIILNGGMGSTVEAQNMTGGIDGILMNGVNHAIYASRYEVQSHAAINLGVDPNVNSAPMISASVSGIELENDFILVNMANCQYCTISALSGTEGDQGSYFASQIGFTIGAAQSCTISASASIHSYTLDSMLVSSSAKNILFTDFMAGNDDVGTVPGAVIWNIQSGATGLTFNATKGP
jgi:hypothetical protein